MTTIREELLETIVQRVSRHSFDYHINFRVVYNFESDTLIVEYSGHNNSNFKGVNICLNLNLVSVILMIV